MKLMSTCLLGIVAASIVLVSRVPVFAQESPSTNAPANPPTIAPAEKLKDGWEDIDDRLVFLMVRLANTETSLAAVEKSLGVNQGARNQPLVM